MNRIFYGLLVAIMLIVTSMKTYCEELANGCDSITLENSNTGFGRIYIAGFVVDEKGQGIPDVHVDIENKNQLIMTMRSMQDGWFESARGLDIPKIGLDIRVTLTKPGYDFLSNIVKIDSNNHIFKCQLITLPGYHPLTRYEDQPTLPLYGYVQKPESQGGTNLAGAKIYLLKPSSNKISENIDSGIVDMSISRDSGFFTLHYDYSLRNSHSEYTLLVEHPEYNLWPEQVKLAQQSQPIIIDNLSERYFDIAWFLRLGAWLPLSGKKLGSNSPFSSHINVLRLFELVFNEDFVLPTESPEYSIYISNYNTEEEDVGSLMLGSSWKPKGVAQKERYVLDIAIGASDIEINREAKHIYKFPQIQFGVSYYKKQLLESFANPHYRLGLTTYQDHKGWNYFIELTLLGI